MHRREGREKEMHRRERDGKEGERGLLLELYIHVCIMRLAVWTLKNASMQYVYSLYTTEYSLMELKL